MTIEEQLRELARRADQRQQAITGAEVVRHADHGFGPFMTHSSANGRDVLRDMPMQFTEEEATVIDLDAPSTTHAPSKGSKRSATARLLAVAAAAIVVVGVAAIAFTVGSRTANDPDGVPQAPAPTVAPTTAAPTTTVAPRTVTRPILGTDITISYTLPDGWEPMGADGLGIFADPATVNFWDVRNVYADGCAHTLLDPPLGSTVDDLATVWATLPGFIATTPVDITVDGYSGKRVDYTVPDYATVLDPATGEEKADCVNFQFGLWTEQYGGLGPNFWAQVPGQQNRQWIVDVDGTRLVINEWSDPGTTPEQLAAMDEFLASIQID